MALLTRAQVRTAIQNAIDDPAATFWSATNLDRLTELVEDMLYEAVLDTFPWFTSQTDLVTPNGSGVVDMLTAPTKRFYRVQSLIRVSDSVPFGAALPSESFPQGTYSIAGTSLATTPAITGASSASLCYSFLPTKYTGLATDATTLPNYPEGHESALIYLTSAWAMTRGDREENTRIAQLADISVDSMLTHIARQSPTGIIPGLEAIRLQLVRRVMNSPVPQSS